MKPSIFVPCCLDKIDNLPDYMKKYYNNKIHTNKTIKKPYGCPNGRRHCSLCSIKKNGNINKKQAQFCDSDL